MAAVLTSAREDFVAKKIANMKARDRRRLSQVHTDGEFPKWKPGMTTAEYIQRFGIHCRGTLLDFGPRVLDKRLGWKNDLSHLDRPAPYLTPEQDAVIFEEAAE